MKVDALERWDADVIGPIVDALDAGSEPFRILLLPDHATPCTIKTHTAESVPYLLFDSTRDAAGGVYTEPATASSPPVAAHELMGRLARSPDLSRADGCRGTVRLPTIRRGCKVYADPSRPWPGAHVPGRGRILAVSRIRFVCLMLATNRRSPPRTSEGTVADCGRSGARAHGATP